MKLYKFAVRVIRFLSNLNATTYDDDYNDVIKCDEVRITNAISTSQKC